MPTFDLATTKVRSGIWKAKKKGVWVLTNHNGEVVALTEELLQVITDVWITEVKEDMDNVERQINLRGGLN